MLQVCFRPAPDRACLWTFTAAGLEALDGGFKGRIVIDMVMLPKIPFLDALRIPTKNKAVTSCSDTPNSTYKRLLGRQSYPYIEGLL